MSVVGATVFQPFSWTQTPSHSSSSPTLSLHDENDDSKWLDHLIGGTNATSSSRRMDDDGADGEDEDETYVTTTASSSSFFTVLTAQVHYFKKPCGAILMLHDYADADGCRLCPVACTEDHQGTAVQSPGRRATTTDDTVGTRFDIGVEASLVSKYRQWSSSISIVVCSGIDA
jgi:hypothetical protein